MIISDPSTLTLVLGEVATTQCGWESSWIDYDVSTGSLTSTNVGNTSGLSNSTTSVTFLGAPSVGVQRQLLSFTIYNSDNVNHTVYIRRDSQNMIAASLVPGASLQWSKNGGWIVFAQRGGSMTLRQYNTGTGTWSKPDNLKGLWACCVGPGGAGGSGRRGAAGTNRFGGGGGGGGAIVSAYFTADALPLSLTYIVGTSGTPGAAVITDDTNGNAGTAGTDTSLDTILVAKAGNPGTGGTSSAGGVAGSGGVGASCVPNFGPYALTGGNASNGVTTAAGNGANGWAGSTGAPGGAGGRGINNSNVSGTGAVTGGGVYNAGILTTGSSVGVNGQDNIAKSFFLNSSLVGLYGIGTAAGGGDVASDAPTPGNYGPGGSGGGGSSNGTPSGAGSSGAGGLITLLEMF